MPAREYYSNGVLIRTEDDRTVPGAQAEAIERAQEHFAELIAAGRKVTIDGVSYTLALDAGSLQHFDSEALAASILLNNTPGAPAWDPNDYWFAIDGSHVPVSSAATALAAAVNLRAYFKALGKNLDALARAIGALSTNAACDAFDVTAGYPENL